MAKTPEEKNYVEASDGRRQCLNSKHKTGCQCFMTPTPPAPIAARTEKVVTYNEAPDAPRTGEKMWGVSTAEQVDAARLELIAEIKQFISSQRGLLNLNIGDLADFVLKRTASLKQETQPPSAIKLLRLLKDELDDINGWMPTALSPGGEIYGQMADMLASSPLETPVSVPNVLWKDSAVLVNPDNHLGAVCD